MSTVTSLNARKPKSAADKETALELALEASELRYRSLFETAQDGILILHANTGEILDVNPFLMDLLAYPLEDLRGHKLWEIAEFKEIAANRSAFEKLQKKEYSRYENLPLRRRDGKLIQVEFVSNVYWVKAEKVIQCHIRDISPRTGLWEESDAHLAALELANSTKNAWLLTHAQNVRVPLMAIASMLGLMELRYNLVHLQPEQDKSSDFDQIALQHIRRNFQSLVHLFNDLCDLTAQPFLGRPPIGKTDLRAATKSKIDQANP
jgi:PAS domain S-box-containing protein